MDLQANERLLRQLASEDFLYCPNPGNAGDSAIACATYRAFDRFGCRYQVVSPHASPQSTRGRVVVYGGGGNLVSYYPNARNFIAAHHREAKRLVVLPHTIDGHAELLRSLGENVQLYCREAASYDYVRSVATGGAQVHFAHDMALMLDVKELMAWGHRQFGSLLNPPTLIWRNVKRSVRVTRHALLNIAHPRTLYAFREDVEKTSVRIPPSNFDVSQMFATDTMSPLYSAEATFSMLCFLNRFSSIHTNRLHVGILSTLLGKKVYFHDNSYGKNLNVYRASLQGNFDNLGVVGAAV